jgi:ferrous iron transport protein B
VNYPGATIEYSVGALAERYQNQIPGIGMQVMDTPGTYSLFPKSQDEEVTLKALFEHPDLPPIKKVILVVDGTQLGRHLLIAQQLRQSGFSLVIALTMSDLLKKSQIEVDISYLREALGVPVVAIDGLLGRGVKGLVGEVAQLSNAVNPQKITPWTSQKMAAELARVDEISQQAVKKSVEMGRSLETIYDSTARLDRFLMHPVGGLFAFFAIMWALFSSIYWLAAPLMDAIDGGFGFVSAWVEGALPAGLYSDFLTQGVLASFAAVFIFLPQIFILFLGIGLLESSGYLARAATLIDRPFSLVGLSGRSFVPILSGFACAVPAVMATRNLTSARDRWITNFVIPLMSCSARLPVYALLLSFLFRGEPAWKAGFALTALYLGSLVVGSLAAAVVHKILARDQRSFFMMELPLYRRPQLRVILRQSAMRTRSYVYRAGPVIFVLAVIIWFGMTFPQADAPQEVRMQSSYLAQLGRMVEPIFTPMGLDWRVGVGILSAFAAREVFVSSLAMMFNLASDAADQSDQLLTTMAEAKNSLGQLIFTPASVVGLLVFFLVALQCMSTVAIQAKENGSLKFALMQLVVFNALAYVLAVALVQGLRALGVA